MNLQNERTFRDFIKEQNREFIRTDWVLWMLGELESLNTNATKLNPDWLRANAKHLVVGQFTINGNTEPEMFD